MRNPPSFLNLPRTDDGDDDGDEDGPTLRWRDATPASRQKSSIMAQGKPKTDRRFLGRRRSELGAAYRINTQRAASRFPPSLLSHSLIKHLLNFLLCARPRSVGRSVGWLAGVQERVRVANRRGGVMHAEKRREMGEEHACTRARAFTMDDDPILLLNRSRKALL